MIKVFLVFMVLVFGIKQTRGQENIRKALKESQTFVKKAEKAKKDGNFVMAEANYRQAMGKDQANAAAHYNMGHLYGDKEMDADGMSQLFKTVKSTKDKSLRHKAYHNLGNAYMKQEDYAQAVNAYKDALRNDPADDETRYNLAIAKEKLEENPNPDDQGDDSDDSDDQDKNEENSQDQEQEKENQDENDNDDEGDDDQDQENQNQDKEEGDQNEDQSGGQGDEDQDDHQDQDQDQDDKGDNNDQNDSDENEQQGNQDFHGLSDEQAENLLKAAENLEKGVQEKMDVKKGKEIKGKPNRKDW